MERIRFVILSDAKAANGLKVIDLGAGHASANQTLSDHILAALKTEALLNELIGAGYIDRHWPPAFKDSGAWPLGSLRQSFLNGILTRLLDPDLVLRARIAEFVSSGEFGLASGVDPGGKYRRVWFREDIGPAEIAFEADVYLLTKSLAQSLKFPEISPFRPSEPVPALPENPVSTPGSDLPSSEPGSPAEHAVVSVSGRIPAEQWNRLGTRLIPKMRAAGSITVTIHLESEVEPVRAVALSVELQHVVDEIGLAGTVRIERRQSNSENGGSKRSQPLIRI